MPALYYLGMQGRLPEKFDIIAVGRREKTTEIYAQEIKEKIIANIGEKADDAAVDDIVSKITYHKQDLNDNKRI